MVTCHDPADRLASLLADRTELEQLKTRADVGDLNAGFRLMDLLADRASWNYCEPAPSPGIPVPSTR
jgi:hypothetical protein